MPPDQTDTDIYIIITASLNAATAAFRLGRRQPAQSVDYPSRQTAAHPAPANGPSTRRTLRFQRSDTQTAFRKIIISTTTLSMSPGQTGTAALIST